MIKISYIRQNQQSEYVDLHGGSREYIYDNGSTVVGWQSYGQWIDSLCLHAERAGLDGDTVSELERALENYHGERRDGEWGATHGKTVGPKPEMAHVIAQFLDSRLDAMELTEDREQLLRDYAAESFCECVDCGASYRKTPYRFDAMGDRCRDCYARNLLRKDVSADLSEPLRYLDEEIPDEVPPDDFHDDEFYGKCMEVIMNAEGERRRALQHQLAQVSDEVMYASVDERPVSKEGMRLAMEMIHDEQV